MEKFENELCPCTSGVTYAACCKPFHDGKEPGKAELVMRARFAAYALNLPEYVIKTTHPASPQYQANRFNWTRSISKFSKSTQFEKLEIHESIEHDPIAMVTFTAHVKQHGKDATFSERSYFEEMHGKWLYKWGRLIEGHLPNIITNAQLRLLPLAYYGDPILRRKGDPIDEITPDIHQLVEEMTETLDACNGVGLAAPQVHHSIQLFIIRKPIPVGNSYELGEIKVYINPKIIQSSKEKKKFSEGCLSIPSIHAEVERPKSITIEYTNLEGKKITESASNFEADVLQHENDHINGILFIDHLAEAERKALEPYLEHIKKRIHDGTEL